jgi:hypothetical protein
MKRALQLRLVAFWASVCTPLAWGVYATVHHAISLFS